MNSKTASGARQITLKSPEEIQILLAANQIVAETLNMLQEKIGSGITTLQLDKWAEDFAREKGAEPAFKGYQGFPGSLCVSLNEQVVHGIPSKKVVLSDGDIVSIDFGVRYKGYYGDAAVTIGIGRIIPEKDKLLRVTREALYKGIEKARVNNRVNDISLAVQSHAEKHGYSVVRQFVGHGIGSELHEAPEVPNFVKDESSPRLLPGMVMAIEPMINMGKCGVQVLKDGWTVVTSDGLPSAHFEHSIAITEEGPVILSNGIH